MVNLIVERWPFQTLPIPARARSNWIKLESKVLFRHISNGTQGFSLFNKWIDVTLQRASRLDK